MKQIIVIDNDSNYFNKIKKSLKKFSEIESVQIVLCNSKNFQHYLKDDENVLGFFVSYTLDDILRVFDDINKQNKHRPCIIVDWSSFPTEILDVIGRTMDAITYADDNSLTSQSVFHIEVVRQALEWAGYVIRSVPCNVPEERFL